MKIFASGLFIAALCVSFSANAARPSFTSLQQQINQLNASINTLESASRRPLVVDANGVLIGDGQEMGSQVAARAIYFDNDPQIYFAPFVGNDFAQHTSVYSLPDCAGTEYIDGISTWGAEDVVDNLNEIATLRSDPNTLYAPSADPVQGITIASYLHPGSTCFNNPGNEPLYEPVPVIDLTQYAKPYKYVFGP